MNEKITVCFLGYVGHYDIYNIDGVLINPKEDKMLREIEVWNPKINKMHLMLEDMDTGEIGKHDKRKDRFVVYWTSKQEATNNGLEVFDGYLHECNRCT